MLIFNDGWNSEIMAYVNRYGGYQAYLSSFNSHSIISAIWSSFGHFNDQWVIKLFNDAQNIHGGGEVRIEQGTHQPELYQNGFKLHFTGRDVDGYAFHFYVIQLNDGRLFIHEITYMSNGNQVTVPYA